MYPKKVDKYVKLIDKNQHGKEDTHVRQKQPGKIQRGIQENHCHPVGTYFISTSPAFYAPAVQKNRLYIPTSGSMAGHLFICHTVSKQNPHIIAAGVENTVNKNFAAVSTVEANVIAAYNKAIITLYIRNRR